MKKSFITDVRIEISPDLGNSSGLFYNTEAKRMKALEDQANEMLAQIKRHVDGARHACIVFDREDRCEHCGYRWTEAGDYNGGCCDKDEEGNPDNIKAEGEAQ